MKTIINKVTNYFNTRSIYNQTVRELNSLSDKELADIGINRTQIHSIANEVYVR